MAEEMYRIAYFDIQKVLDEAIGPDEDAGLGEGIARDVWLVVRERDVARTLLRKAIDRLTNFDHAVATEILEESERPVSIDD